MKLKNESKHELPKSVRVQLIPLDHKAYSMLAKIRQKYHREIRKARIALAWRIALKPDRDGHLVLGKCLRTSDLQRELAEWDFVILLNKEVWNEPEFDKHKKQALLHHELCHAGVVYNKKGKQKKDERGRYVFRSRRHDVEEFRSVVRHYGIWKKDLEEFAEALLKRRKG